MNYAQIWNWNELMSNTERGEIMTGIYKLRADCGAIYARCQEARALHLGVSLAAVQTLLNEALEDCQPDAPEYVNPPAFKLSPGRD